MKPNHSFARKLIKDLEENVYCRLRPSKIQGVGIFAIRDIPKGKDPFKSFLPYEFVTIPAAAVLKNPKIDPVVRKFASDMYVVEDGLLYLYKGGLNGIDISFFLNHSVKPNVKAVNDGEGFFAARKIKK